MFGTLRTDPKLTFNKNEFFVERSSNTKRFSISGVQPKLLIKATQEKLDTTDCHGEFILKPSPIEYPELSENEFLTMHINKMLGVKVPHMALVQFTDGELAYLVKRFDRERTYKLHCEDMAQAMDIDKDEAENYKYESKSYEEVCHFIRQNYSKADAFELFNRVFINYMTGNNDFHLKNISVLAGKSSIYTISPAYDCVNAAIYFDDNEIAMDLYDGYTDEFPFSLLGFISKANFDELANRIEMPLAYRETIYENYLDNYQVITDFIANSILSKEQKDKYLVKLADRLRKFQTALPGEA